MGLKGIYFNFDWLQKKSFTDYKSSFCKCTILPGIFFLVGLFFNPDVNAQSFSFAHVTDTHVGGSTGVEDLERTIKDINSLPQIEFVLFTGDLTEFGSGEELREAKKIIDRLNKPYYVVPGNHDAKWSESGCNDFVKIFGSETFAFEKQGFLFVGTASGPDMRMAPALVPREQLSFLDSVLSQVKNPEEPVIFVNHYPLDESLSNSPIIIEKLKRVNIEAVLLGHGHQNKIFNFEGIPGIMGRSNLRASQPAGGYNIATIQNDSLYYAERIPGQQTHPVWCKIPLYHSRHLSPERNRPAADTVSSNVRMIWQTEEKSNIGSAIASRGKSSVYACTDGRICARNLKNGSLRWELSTGGKVYSTPAISGNKIVCPSTDGHIYCLNRKNGKIIWNYKTDKPIVASPVIKKREVYVGSSEGIFRKLSLSSGRVIWYYDSIRNFVETRPLLYKDKVYFGSWGNTFYALDKKSGKLAWKRVKYGNRMLSPAAVWPVAAEGKIFIVAPDRHFTALDARTGKEIWDSGKYSCRESMGISGNKKLVYIKNMTEGNVDAFCTRSDTMKLAWECKAGLGYEIAPSPITESGKLVFIPTTAGMVYAIDKKSHLIAWKYKVSDTLINCIQPIRGHRLLITTFDGKVICLKYQ